VSALAHHRRSRAAAAALCALATTIAAGWLLSVPGDEAARPPEAHYAAPIGLAADTGHTPARKRLSAAWHGGLLVAASGESVTVYVSDAYSPEQVSPQAWAEFFAALLHADELRLATIRIAPLPEVTELCGPEALGCYGGDELVVAGEVVGGVTPEEIARHEYGHHVAAHRVNPPWRALDWGPKRWATVEDVCRRTAAKTAFPADEGEHYRLNPAEAFAEAYRAANEARAGIAFGWGLVDGSFYPDAAALEAVAQDVSAAWSAATRVSVSRLFTAKGPRRLLVPLVLPLDGEVEVELRLPASRLDELELVTPDGRTVLARGLWTGTTTRRLQYVACGVRKVAVRVTRKGLPGRFELALSRP
jgi:hypothetical protein